MYFKRQIFVVKAILVCSLLVMLNGCTASIDSNLPEGSKLRTSEAKPVKNGDPNADQVTSPIYNEGAEADFPFFTTIEEMEGRAMAVVVGEIVDYGGIQEVQLSDDLSMSYHIYTLKIHKSLKGVLDREQKILLKVLAGDPGADASKLLNDKHRSYLLYLDIYDDSPATLLSPAQAVIAWNPSDGILYTDTARTYIEKKIANGLSAQEVISIFDQK